MSKFPVWKCKLFLRTFACFVISLALLLLVYLCDSLQNDIHVSVHSQDGQLSGKKRPYSDRIYEVNVLTTSVRYEDVFWVVAL